jgi:hypothetical protein
MTIFIYTVGSLIVVLLFLILAVTKRIQIATAPAPGEENFFLMEQEKALAKAAKRQAAQVQPAPAQP